ncbi:unnamed protein product, partial [Amoebophrya sp. A25]|eukprot:GSA25T00009595001.1
MIKFRLYQKYRNHSINEDVHLLTERDFIGALTALSSSGYPFSSSEIEQCLDRMSQGSRTSWSWDQTRPKDICALLKWAQRSHEYYLGFGPGHEQGMGNGNSVLGLDSKLNTLAGELLTQLQVKAAAVEAKNVLEALSFCASANSRLQNVHVHDMDSRSEDHVAGDGINGGEAGETRLATAERSLLKQHIVEITPWLACELRRSVQDLTCEEHLCVLQDLIKLREHLEEPEIFLDLMGQFVGN